MNEDELCFVILALGDTFLYVSVCTSDIKRTDITRFWNQSRNESVQQHTGVSNTADLIHFEMNNIMQNIHFSNDMYCFMSKKNELLIILLKLVFF